MEEKQLECGNSFCKRTYPESFGVVCPICEDTIYDAQQDFRQLEDQWEDE